MDWEMGGDGMKEYPPYSFLMSVYNKERPNYLKESFDCIFSQTVLPNEVVLIEDGPLSRDLYSVIERYKKIIQIF